MNGPTINDYGDVISSNLVPTQGLDAGRILYGEYSLLQGQIIQIYTIDDSQNNPSGKGKYTVYDVQAWLPNGGTEIIRRCRMLQPGFGGGFTNFFEVVPQDPGPKAKDDKNDRALKRGSTVLVGFISGQKVAGVILGAMPHPSEVAAALRPTKKDGTHLEYEFQGLNFQHANDGSYKITFNGPKDDKGLPIDATVGPTTFEIDKTGSINIKTNENQQFFIDRVQKQITCINGQTKWIMSQDGSKIEVECEDLSITTDNDVTVNATGKTTVNSQDDVVISSASMIKLQRGDADPSEPFVLGSTFKAFMQDLLTAISSITHLGNLGAPTPPPLNAAQVTALLGRLDTLLSKLIVGDT